MTAELKGKLEYTSLFEPIKLIGEEKEIDLRDYYFPLLEKLNGKKSRMDDQRRSIEIYGDETSENIIEYQNAGDGILMLIKRIDGKGVSNIAAYLPDALQRLNGRQVIVEVSEKNGLKLFANPEEKVFGLYYTGAGNGCKIPEGAEKTVCKIGTDDCCIFCCLGAGGFGCLKFDSLSTRQILQRHAKKEMNATRIGNCEVLGRKD